MKEALDSSSWSGNVGLSLGAKTGNEQDIEQIGSTNVTYNELGNSETLAMPESSNANEPSEHPSLNDNAVSLCQNLELDAGHVSRVDVASHNVIFDKIESASASSKHPITSSSGLVSHSNYNLKNTGSSDFHSSYEHHKDVSSAASDLQQSSIRNSELEVQSSEDHCAVVLADHLQALADECPHLIFGTYNGGSNSASSVMLASNTSRSGLEEKTAAVHGSSAQCLDASSSSVNRGDEQLGFDALGETSGDKNFDLLSSHQQQLEKTILPESILEDEYNVMPSVTDCSFEESQSVTHSLPFRSPGLQSGNLSNVPGEVGMEPGTFALPHRFAHPQDLMAQSSRCLEQLADTRRYHPLPQHQQYTTTVNLQLALSDSNAAYRYNQPSANMNYNLPQNRNEFRRHRLPHARDALGYGNLSSPSYNHGNFMSTSSLGHMPSSNFNNNLPSQHYGAPGLRPTQRRASFRLRDYGAETRHLFLQERAQHSPPGQPSQASPQHVRPGYSDLHHSQTEVAEETQWPGNFQDLTSNHSRHFWRQNH